MIPCQKCQSDNPLGTVFCRSCGARLETSLQMVMASVKTTTTQNRDTDLLGWGRSAISLCGFMLIVALVVRYAVVPAPPQPDLAPAPPIELFRDQPPWAEATIAASQTADLGDLIPKANRLSWRGTNAGPFLSAFSLDLKPLRDAQETLIKAQKSDGSFPGPDPMASTALGALGLQAMPTDAALLGAASRARAWLKANWPERDPLARALAVAALADAEDLSDATRTRYGVLLVDGKAPSWQAFLLPLLTPDLRPKQTVALENALDSTLWQAYFALMAGREIPNDPKPFFSEYASGLTNPMDRLAWVTLGWYHPLAPNDLASVLRGWNSGPDPVPDAELTKACGSLAVPVMRLLVSAAPLRVPVLGLGQGK